MAMLEALTLNTNLLSLSSLLGTDSSQRVLNEINARSGGNSFFNSVSDPFREGFNLFMQNVVTPLRELSQVAKSTATKLFSTDVARPIMSLEELKKGVAPCMQLPIVYYAPIRQMLEEERIFGYGINPRTLEDTDIYEPHIESGHVGLSAEDLPKSGEITIRFHYDSSDIDLSMEDRQALRETRRFIDEFMTDEDMKCLDFTDPDNLHA